QRRLDRLAHRAAERDALLELHRHRFGDQLRVELRLLDLLDVDEDLAAGPLLDLLLQLVDFRSLAADDDARARGVDVDLQLVGGALGFDPRDAGMREPLLEVLPQREVLVQELRVVAVRVPARPPGLVEPEPESVGMNLLAHVCSLFLGCGLAGRRLLCRAGFGAASLARARRLRRRGRIAFGRDAGNLQRPFRDAHGQVRCALGDTERPAHRGGTHALHRRPLVGVARLDEQPLNVAAEAVLLLRVGDRRPQHLGDLAGDRLPRELEGCQRLVDAFAANQLAHEARLLGRGADAARGRLSLDHDAFAPPPPPPPAPAGAPAGAAAAVAAAFSLLVVCPLNVRVGANSPSLWPTMFSVTYTGMNFFPLCTAIVWPTISGTTVERRDQVLTTFFSFARFIPSIFSRSEVSTNGPFFSDRLITSVSSGRCIGSCPCAGASYSPWSAA